MAGVDNLKPFEKGDDPRRNLNGNYRGTKHLSTWIKEMMNDEDFELFLTHPTKGYEQFKGAPVKAIVTTALRRAANGDNRWADWLAKYGDGAKVTHANDPDNPIPGNSTRELSDEELNERIDSHLKQRGVK